VYKSKVKKQVWSKNGLDDLNEKAEES
jgi:hypothetical protein